MDIVQLCPEFSSHAGDFPTGQALAVLAIQPADPLGTMSAMGQKCKLARKHRRIKRPGLARPRSMQKRLSAFFPASPAFKRAMRDIHGPAKIPGNNVRMSHRMAILNPVIDPANRHPTTIEIHRGHKVFCGRNEDFLRPLANNEDLILRYF